MRRLEDPRAGVATEGAGIDRAYAFQHTGLIPTEANRHPLSEEDAVEVADGQVVTVRGQRRGRW